MTKGIKALKEIKRLNTYCRDTGRYDILIDKQYNESYDIIEKELKALELIKEKDVRPSDILMNKDYDAYMFDRTYQEGWTLIKEEFDFLKEVFG